MATKSIAWQSGTGYITLSYTGEGNDSISITSDSNDLFESRLLSISINTTAGTPQKVVNLLVKLEGKTYPSGTIFNFNYTGTVLEVLLPKGRYKLLCWGALGGNSYSYSGIGSKGGYSEGILNINSPTTIYIFVGGAGSSGSSSSLYNGGWNGGGGSVGTTSYNSGNEYGISYPATGGGSTDMCLITSSMSYLSGRTNRANTSLLSRFIVAGGGAGGSAYYREVTSTVTNTITDLSIPSGTKYGSYNDKFINSSNGYIADASANGVQGDVFYLGWLTPGKVYTFTGQILTIAIYTSSSPSPSTYSGIELAPSSGVNYFTARNYYYVAYSYNPSLDPVDYYNSCILTHKESTTSTSTSNGSSNSFQLGGGVQGKGSYPGTLTSAGNNGAFGIGANLTVTNYRYASGAGGGGWYGGGSSYSDSSTSQINSSGGGSGFVYISGASVPSGYTGLQLESGSTIDGANSFPTTSGSTEVGHSGNGYAKITVL